MEGGKYLEMSVSINIASQIEGDSVKVSCRHTFVVSNLCLQKKIKN